MKPAGRGFSTRPRGVRRRCIHDPRSMHFAAADRRERCIKSDGRSSRSAPSLVVDCAGISAEPSQSVEFDGVAPPVHTEGYE